MKKIIIIISVLLGVISISCTRENIETADTKNSDIVKFTFSASREQIDPEAKTYLQENGVSIGWNVGDFVTLYYRDLDAQSPETQYDTAVVTSFNNGVATFETLIPSGMSRFEMFAVYGCLHYRNDIFEYKDNDEDTKKAGTRKQRVKIVEIQQAYRNSFDPEYANCVAHAVVTDITQPPVLKFYNCFALVGFNMTTSGVQIDSVILQTGGTPAYSDYLSFPGLENSGTDATPTLKGSSAQSKSVRIENPASDGRYYFLVSSHSISDKNKNLKITFCNSSGSRLSKNASFSGSPISRNKVLDLGSFDLPEDKWNGVLNFTEKEAHIKSDITSLNVSVKSNVAWTATITNSASQPVAGASVSPASGVAGTTPLQITVPVNKSCAQDSIYIVTVTTTDEKIPAEKRTISYKITQEKTSRAYFGTIWGTDFLSHVRATDQTTEPIDGITFLIWPSKNTETNRLHGKFLMSFISAASGNALVTVKKAYLSQSGSSKYLQIFVNMENRAKVALTTTKTEYIKNIGSVAVGDTIKIGTCSLGGGYSTSNSYFETVDNCLFSFDEDTSN